MAANPTATSTGLGRTTRWEPPASTRSGKTRSLAVGLLLGATLASTAWFVQRRTPNAAPTLAEGARPRAERNDRTERSLPRVPVRPAFAARVNEPSAASELEHGDSPLTEP